jgi:hypothetical protein
MTRSAGHREKFSGPARSAIEVRGPQHFAFSPTTSLCHPLVHHSCGRCRCEARCVVRNRQAKGAPAWSGSDFQIAQADPRVLSPSLGLGSLQSDGERRDQIRRRLPPRQTMTASCVAVAVMEARHHSGQRWAALSVRTRVTRPRLSARRCAADHQSPVGHGSSDYLANEHETVGQEDRNCHPL